MTILETFDVVKDFLDEPLLLFFIRQVYQWLRYAARRRVKHIQVLTKFEERLFPFVLAYVFDVFGKLGQYFGISLVNLDLKFDDEKLCFLTDAIGQPYHFCLLVHSITFLFYFFDLA